MLKRASGFATDQTYPSAESAYFSLNSIRAITRSTRAWWASVSRRLAVGGPPAPRLWSIALIGDPRLTPAPECRTTFVRLPGQHPREEIATRLQYAPHAQYLG